MSLGATARRNRVARRTVMAIPKGPVGADATVNNAGISGNFANQVYQNKCGFAQAADFYDSVGVNTHFREPPTNNRFNGVVTALSNLGVRHVRDGIYASFYDFAWQFWRPGILAIHNHNRALPIGKQPIFVTGGLGGGSDSYNIDTRVSPENGGEVYNVAFTYKAMQGKHRHFVGNAGGPQNTALGDPTPENTWHANDVEVPWAVLSSIQGINEPQGGTSHYSLIPAWQQQMTDQKNRQRHTQAFGGLPWLGDDGLIHTEPCWFNQIPTINMGGGVQDGAMWPVVGDTSKPNQQIDVNDFHFYPSDTPCFEQLNGQWYNAHGYNGEYRSPSGRISPRTKPVTVTESGWIDSGTNAEVPSARAGFYPFPDDVIAEYAVRMFLTHYAWGIRRTYYYSFINEQSEDPNYSESNFGLIRQDLTGKKQYYSLRNMLALTQFSQAANPANRTAISYTITGFNHGADNYLTSLYYNDTFQYSKDRLCSLLLQQSDTVYILWIWRNRSLYDREPKVYFTPDTQNLTVSLPANTVSVQVAQPTLGGNTTPIDGKTWSNVTATSGTNYPVAISGYTKALKITLN